MNGIPTRLRIPQQGRFEGMNPTFPGFGAVMGPRIAPWTVMGNGNRAPRAPQESNQSVDCAEALKRAALPASRRTFCRRRLSHLAPRSSCWRGRCRQPGDQRQDFPEHLSWHRDLDHLEVT
jgi:hypothetical protein